MLTGSAFSSSQQETIQREFSHLKDKPVFNFNTAYFGPSPLRAKNYMLEMIKEEMDSTYLPYQNWMKTPHEIRESLSKLIPVKKENIFHSTSTTDTNILIAQHYPFAADDYYCVFEGEYPSNVLPYLRRAEKGHFKVKILELPPEGEPIDVSYLQKNLPTKCKALTISHLSFNSGRYTDLSVIGPYLRSRNVMLFVDGTQFVGGHSLSSKEIQYADVYNFSTYKWMLGGYGHAFSYFSDNFFNKLDISHGNWLSEISDVARLTDYSMVDSKNLRPYHLDRGQAANRLLMSALKGSLELFHEIGLSAIEKHNQSLAQHFIKEFQFKKFKLSCAKEEIKHIVCLTCTDKNLNSALALSELQKHQIDASVREGNIRLSFHLFNELPQVEKLLDVLSSTV